MKARIKFGLQKTINIGNYENARINVELEQLVDGEGTRDDLDFLFKEIRGWVKEKVEEEEAVVLGKIDQKRMACAGSIPEGWRRPTYVSLDGEFGDAGHLETFTTGSSSRPTVTPLVGKDGAIEQQKERLE